MKLKNFVLVMFCALVLVFSAGCTPKNNTKYQSIDMPVYFSSTIKSNVYINTNGSYISHYSLRLSSLVSGKILVDDLNRYQSITVEGNSNWLYGMYIECIYFSVCANQNKVINQFEISVSGLDGGDKYNQESQTYSIEKTLEVKTRAYGMAEYKLNINKKYLKKDVSFLLNFVVNDPNVSGDENFKWSIVNLKVYGSHNY